MYLRDPAVEDREFFPVLGGVPVGRVLGLPGLFNGVFDLGAASREKAAYGLGPHEVDAYREYYEVYYLPGHPRVAVAALRGGERQRGDDEAYYKEADYAPFEHLARYVPGKGLCFGPEPGDGALFARLDLIPDAGKLAEGFGP